MKKWTCELKIKQYYNSDTGLPTFQLKSHEIKEDDTTIAIIMDGSPKRAIDLIPQAPALYEECEILIEVVEKCITPSLELDAIVSHAKRIMAKARGENVE